MSKQIEVIKFCLKVPEGYIGDLKKIFHSPSMMVQLIQKDGSRNSKFEDEVWLIKRMTNLGLVQQWEGYFRLTDIGITILHPNPNE